MPYTRDGRSPGAVTSVVLNDTIDTPISLPTTTTLQRTQNERNGNRVEKSKGSGDET